MKVAVTVHPNSKKPRLELKSAGELHIYVSQPPLDGKANKAVIETLAKHFGVSKSKVVLTRGEKYKNKIFNINVQK
jgi:uncharacterized protein (TIGR00251 family)